MAAALRPGDRVRYVEAGPRSDAFQVRFGGSVVWVPADRLEPDAATEPHPLLEPPAASDRALQDALPEITAAARKVGGFRRLAEIAAQLDRAGVGR
jgi:hypothetical protein